ncbi:hypothetical protein BEH94_04975 [Candidatus Altiarchaeales archaeon WOR_SM1_SCG]|nr:hypothetical protein BEH94_04975 [Candidatus Altiarchaeales archaeon WOR_SM1_SCG]
MTEILYKEQKDSQNGESAQTKFPLTKLFFSIFSNKERGENKHRQEERKNKDEEFERVHKISGDNDVEQRNYMLGVPIQINSTLTKGICHAFVDDTFADPEDPDYALIFGRFSYAFNCARGILTTTDFEIYKFVSGYGKFSFKPEAVYINENNKEVVFMGTRSDTERFAIMKTGKEHNILCKALWFEIYEDFEIFTKNAKSKSNIINKKEFINLFLKYSPHRSMSHASIGFVMFFIIFIISIHTYYDPYFNFTFTVIFLICALLCLSGGISNLHTIRKIKKGHIDSVLFTGYFNPGKDGITWEPSLWDD